MLYIALEDTLEARGVLGQIKARIRAEIFQAIEDQVRVYFQMVIVSFM